MQLLVTKVLARLTWVLASSTLTADTYANGESDYRGVVGRWAVTGDFNNLGFVCGATVRTKVLGDVIVGYVAIGNNANYFLTLKNVDAEGLFRRNGPKTFLETDIF